MSNQKDWHSELAQWKQYNQSHTPPDLQVLLDDFTRRFPRASLSTMPLETYAAGKPDGFCYILEHTTRPLGSIRGGGSDKFGVYRGQDGIWRHNSTHCSYEQAVEHYERYRQGMVDLLEAAERGDGVALDSPMRIKLILKDAPVASWDYHSL